MKNPPSRVLRLTSPLMHGDDVRRLQSALNDRRKARNLPPISVDGQYGEQTAGATRSMAITLGVLESTLDKGATKQVQKIIRDPDVRTKAQLDRAAARAKAAEKAGEGPEAALKIARSKIGVKEHPAGSNGGPQIDDWQKAVGMGRGPWCGVFAAFVVRSGGGHPTDRWRYTPWIVADAKTKTGGFEGWCAITDPLAKPGDLVLYDWDGDGVADHVGVLETTVHNGAFEDIEGNTAVGNDSNGGEVMRRTRRADRTVLGVARVRWS